MEKIDGSVEFAEGMGFPAEKRSHLIGCGDPSLPWQKEWRRALRNGVESVVFFAIDQYCLVGYRRSGEKLRKKARWQGA